MHKFFPMALLLPIVAIAAPFTPAQEQAIQKIVRTEIKNNPTAIIQSLQDFRQQSMKTEKEHSVTAAKQMKKELVFNSQDPSIGPAKASVTIVEFLDYQCGHCRDMAKTMDAILTTDKDVRLVIKELPIFKGNSLLAAKAAIAAAKQGKFAAMHHAIFNHKGPLNDKELTTLASNIGLNIELFNNTRHNKATAQLIDQNFALAKKLGLQGTPAFIVTATFGDKLSVLPGAVPKTILNSTIKGMRS